MTITQTPVHSHAVALAQWETLADKESRHCAPSEQCVIVGLSEVRSRKKEEEEEEDFLPPWKEKDTEVEEWRGREKVGKTG